MTNPIDPNDADDLAQGPTPRVRRSGGGRPEPDLDQFDPTAPPRRMTLRGAPATVALIIVMALVSLAMEVNIDWQYRIIETFAMSPLQVYAIMEGALPLSEAKSLVTHAFLHGGLLHLLFNMMAFLALGPPVERALGTLVYVPVYIALGVAGGLAHVGWEWAVFSFAGGQDPTLLMTPLVGASGAIFGVLGADLGRRSRAVEAIPPAYRAITPLGYLAKASAGVVVVNIVLMISGLPISGAAHLGGFALGVLLSRVLFRPGGGRVI